MEFNKAKVAYKIPFVLLLTKGKSVLDIGCVGQDNDFTSESWVHKHLKVSSSALLGVDINKDGISKANSLGYHVIHPSELEDQKFEVITMLDVIEHVNDICQFIEFYKKYLDKDGILVITTPNPFNIRQFFNIALFGKPSINPEHTSFIDPINFLEISNRIDMKIESFYWLKEYDQPRKLYMKILQFMVFPIFRKLRRHFEANYAVILKNN